MVFHSWQRRCTIPLHRPHRIPGWISPPFLGSCCSRCRRCSSHFRKQHNFSLWHGLLSNLDTRRNSYWFICLFLDTEHSSGLRHRKYKKITQCRDLSFEFFRLLGYYSAWSALKAAFRDYLSVDSLTLEDGPIGSPETSVSNHLT
jgi:hypothetical protein